MSNKPRRLLPVLLIALLFWGGLFGCAPKKAVERPSTSLQALNRTATSAQPQVSGGSATQAEDSISRKVIDETPQPNDPQPPTTGQADSEPAPSDAILTGDLTVRFLDVGQGDSIFITLPDKTTILIDASTKAQGNTVVSAIEAQSVKKLDHVIFTHPHEDHIGGGVAVLNAFEVGQVWMPRTSHTTQTYENLLLAIQDKGLMIDEAKAGKVLVQEQNLRAWFLGPSRTYADLNNMSAVLALTYGNATFLFMGDAETEAEQAMLGSGVSEANVLKVGHHGSSTSTSQAFLDAVSPGIAVISVGAGNSYGHPTQSTLDRLAAAGVDVYRTDVHGTVTVTSDSRNLNVAFSPKTVTPKPVAEASKPKVESHKPEEEAPKQQEPEKVPEPVNQEVTVYITKTGKKYHRDGCGSLSKSKIPITLEESKAKGYEPCKTCNPPL